MSTVPTIVQEMGFVATMELASATRSGTVPRVPSARAPRTAPFLTESAKLVLVLVSQASEANIIIISQLLARL